MRILLLVAVALALPALAEEKKDAKTVDATIVVPAARAAKKKNAALVEKIRRRLANVEKKSERATDAKTVLAIREALVSADAALAAQADDSVETVLLGESAYTINHKPKKREAAPEPVQAPKAATSDHKPSPRPDPETRPYECGSIECKAAGGKAMAELGLIRTSLALHYGETEGAYPATLEELAPKHFAKVPALRVGGHPETSAVRVVTRADGKSPGAYVEDTGGWLYFRTPDNPELDGRLVIDCAHAGHKGRPYWGL